jgi:hypothetical protein
MKPEAAQRVYWTKVSTNTKVRIGPIAKKVVRTLSHAPAKPEHRRYLGPIAESGSRLKELASLRGENVWCRVHNPLARELGDGRHRVESEDKSK